MIGNVKVNAYSIRELDPKEAPLSLQDLIEFLKPITITIFSI